MKAKQFTANRDASEISLINPLSIGDCIDLDGPTGSLVWQVGQSSYGWNLHRPGYRTEVHKVIKDIPGMLEFIQAILYHSKTD